MALSPLRLAHRLGPRPFARPRPAGGDWLLHAFESNFESIRTFTFLLTGDAGRTSAIALEAFQRLWGYRERVKPKQITPLLHSIALGLSGRAPHRHGLQQCVSRRSISEGLREGLSPAEIERLDAVISELPFLPRLVFLMNRMDDCSLPEIAYRLSIGLPVIERKMAIALKTVANALGVEGVEQARLLAPPLFPLSHTDTWQHLQEFARRGSRALHRMNRLIGLAAGLMLLIVLLSIGIEWRFAKERITTPADKEALKMLPDSSFVILEANSHLSRRRYGWTYYRRIELRGAAHFTVYPKPAQFVVVIDTFNISTAQGRFSVSFQDPLLRVSCQEGTLSIVWGAADTLWLRGNQDIILKVQRGPWPYVDIVTRSAPPVSL